MSRGARAVVVIGVGVGFLLGCGRSDLDPFAPVGLHGDAATVYRDDARAPAGPDGGAGGGRGDGGAGARVDARADAAPGAGGAGGGPLDPCGGICSPRARCSRGSFAIGQVLMTGQTPDVLASADFDGDGALDLVVANRNAIRPSVFYGRGDGKFDYSMELDGRSAYQAALAVGDFDGDGRPDLASADNFYLNIWHGEGSRQFSVTQQYKIAAQTSAITAADLDRDGALDLALTTFDQSTVLLFKGDGHGAFTQIGKAVAGDEPTFIAAADINRDKNLDLVVINPGSDEISVLDGHGDGTFGAARNRTLLWDPTCAALADFDGDGILDVAVNDMGGIGLLIGDGNGAWVTEVRSPVPSGVVWLTAADLDADGTPDLAVGSISNTIGTGNGSVTVMLGNSDAPGTFLPAQSFHTGSVPNSIAAADLNGDGHPDLAVADYLDNTLTILLWSDGYSCR